MFQPSVFPAPPPHRVGCPSPSPHPGDYGWACMHTYAYICLRMLSSMLMYAHAHVYTSIHLYVSVLLMHACMHACMHIC